MSILRRRRPAAPSAWDVQVVTTWGGRCYPARSRTEAAAIARQQRAAGSLDVLRVRVVPA